MHDVPCLVMNPGERECVGISRYSNPFFAGLVVIAGEFHPIPFRTRPLKPPAPMVLRVNTRESRSPPGLQRTDHQTIPPCTSSKAHLRGGGHIKTKAPRSRAGLFVFPFYCRSRPSRGCA